MTINSRNKGSAFERAVAIELELLTGIRFKRDIEQYRAADHGDLIPSDPAWPFVVECKRYASGTGCAPAWKAQASKAAAAEGKLPAVIFKFDRRDVRVAVQLQSIGIALGRAWEEPSWADVSMDAFAYLAREIMAQTNSDTGGAKAPGTAPPGAPVSQPTQRTNGEATSQGAKL